MVDRKKKSSSSRRSTTRSSKGGRSSSRGSTTRGTRRRSGSSEEQELRTASPSAPAEPRGTEKGRPSTRPVSEGLEGSVLDEDTRSSR
jgi:hypothetical protein